MKVRVHRTKGYTVMSNYHLMDTRLSLKEKGMLSMMLALPDTWHYTGRGLTELSKDGRDSTLKTIKSLEGYGYIHREELRGENGEYTGILYHIYETPTNVQLEMDMPSPSLPNPENQDTVARRNNIRRNYEKRNQRYTPHSIHFANERTYTQADFDALLTDVDDIDI